MSAVWRQRVYLPRTLAASVFSTSREEEHVTTQAKLVLLSPFRPDAPWRDPAGCRSADSQTRFPVGDAAVAGAVAPAATAVCRTCVVPSPCLEEALETKQVNGIGGGFTGCERRRLRRARVAARRLRAG